MSSVTIRRRDERHRTSILRYAMAMTLAVAVLAPAARSGVSHAASAAASGVTCRVSPALLRQGDLPVACLSSILTHRTDAASFGAMTPARSAITPDKVNTSFIITNFAGGLNGGGAPVDYGMIPPSVTLFGPGRLLIGDSGNYLVWFANLSSTVVRLYGRTVAAGHMVPIAGNTSAGFSGDGGPATQAQLQSLNSLATDSGGNLYIADSGNNRIREVLVQTGIITTVAGNGSAGYGGDGGPATQATLYNPYGVAVSALGSFYIADTDNHRVRRVDAASGIITTVAGNGTYGSLGDGYPATKAELSNPVSVALDKSYNIFISDQNNQRIREVQEPSTIMRTLAGTGSTGYNGDGGPAYLAWLNDPAGIATDSAGNVYIADRGNDRIREVIARTLTISTDIGNGQGRFYGDGGLATDAALYSPQGVALDGFGNVYVADTSNGRIREDTFSTGIINTVAGTGACCVFSGDGGPATGAVLYVPKGMVMDKAGDIFFADTNNNRIREILADTYIITTVAGSGVRGYSGDGGPATKAELNLPVDVAVDNAGNLYIADTNNNRIREVIAGTGVMTTIAGTGTAGFFGDGGPARHAYIDTPEGVAVDSSGDLFFSDQQNQRIRVVYTRVGTINTYAGNGIPGYSGDGGPATKAELNFPTGVTVDRLGNLYIGDTANYLVRKVYVNSHIIATVAGGGKGCPAQSNSVGDGCKATQAVMNHPTGVAIDNAGDLFIGDSDDARIREVITGTQIITTVAGNGTPGYSGDGGPATQAEINNPTGVVTDTSGHVYIADTNNNRIRVARYR